MAVARQRRGVGANFAKHATSAQDWPFLPNFIKNSQAASHPGEVEVSKQERLCLHSKLSCRHYGRLIGSVKEWSSSVHRTDSSASLTNGQWQRVP